jgi:Flp pilus assembly pilin Flp
MRKFRRLIALPAGRRRRALMRMAARVVSDEKGGEVLEYALVAGLVVVGAIATISCVGTKMASRWRTVNNAIPN